MEWTYGAPILQLPSAAGISPMALENAIQLRLFLHDGFRWGWNYPLEKLDSPIVDLLNVRYIITRAEDVPRMAAIPKFRHLASLPGNELFENRTAFPRFFLVHQARAVKSLEEARDLILRDISRSTADRHCRSADRAGLQAVTADEVKTLKYEPNSIELSAQASRAVVAGAFGNLLSRMEGLAGRSARAHLFHRHRVTRRYCSGGGASRSHGVSPADPSDLARDLAREPRFYWRFRAFVYRRNASRIQLN